MQTFGGAQLTVSRPRGWRSQDRLGFSAERYVVDKRIIPRVLGSASARDRVRLEAGLRAALGLGAR